LEKEEYINIEKQFIGRKPNTRYSATKIETTAFKEHINALERIINKQK